MGAGRKTQNSSMGKTTQQQPPPPQHFHIDNASMSARNLSKKDIGAVIFSCKHSTRAECRRKQLFGLPASHISYVRNIQPGLPLFLFNETDRYMYGIFEAASNGQMNIDPYGWTADGSEKTPYPAQVRIRTRKECKPLSEEEYRPIISDNYHGGNLQFWFELDHAQTGALLSLFESSPGTTVVGHVVPVRIHPHDAATNEQKHPKPAKKKAFSETAPIGSSSMIQGSKEDNEVDRVGMERDVELVYLKLRQIALDRENLNTSPKAHTEEACVPCMTRKTCLENECPPAAPLVSEQCEDVSAGSSGFQSEIYQLRNDVEDLKVLLSQSLSFTNALENMLASSNAEIQQLRERVMVLESTMKISPAPSVGEPPESQG